MSRELDAAGITEPGLRLAYQRCRRLNAQHGRTYFLATRLLTPVQRPAVHALYGFARCADDIVDNGAPSAERTHESGRLDTLEQELRRGLRQGRSADPVLGAVVDTATRYSIDPGLFEDFLRSMRMDLTVTDYPDRAALDAYVLGSAEAIGLQLLPVLDTTVPREEAAPYAAALGKAFQLTNFLRDIAEDLDRGRVYLPADELAAFGVDRDVLAWCRRHRRTDQRVRSAMTAQHAHTKRIYRYARLGIELLHPRSRPCVQTAYLLYSEILHRIEDSDFAVFAQRARVGHTRRAQVACGALIRSFRAEPGLPYAAAQRRAHPGGSVREKPRWPR